MTLYLFNFGDFVWMIVLLCREKFGLIVPTLDSWLYWLLEEKAANLYICSFCFLTAFFCWTCGPNIVFAFFTPRQLLVAGFSIHVDITRAHEIANEARRVKKQLKESQEMALLYNNRERIFGMPVTNVSVASYLPLHQALCRQQGPRFLIGPLNATAM